MRDIILTDFANDILLKCYLTHTARNTSLQSEIEGPVDLSRFKPQLKTLLFEHVYSVVQCF